MAERLTKQRIDRFVHEGGWDVRWDSDVTGLGVRVYPSGKKSFVLSYRAKTGSRRKHLIVLGPVGPLTLEQARAAARLKIADVLKGRDPAGERGALRQIGTFGDLFKAYLEHHARPHKKTWGEDLRRFNLHIPKRWKARAPGEITREDVRQLHLRIGGSSPYEANRVLALLRVIFNSGRRSGVLPEGHPNPAVDINLFRERSRKRYASPEEVEAIVEAIDGEPNVHVRGLIWLYLLTGARRNELLRSKWADIDRERRRLHLPETKSGEEQTIPLSTPALAILDALPKVAGNPYVFPGLRQGQHFVNIAKPWKRILARAGVNDLRLHDLRRTVGSWMSQDGVEINTVKAALRHSNISTTLIYARLHEDVAAEALEQHGQRLMRLGGGPKAAGAS